jgi:hypothetical protein
MAACEMVTLVPPVLVMVPDDVCLLPKAMLPKASLEGFDVSSPTANPVPERGMVRVGFGAFEVTVIFPVALPADCGAKDTLKLALWPALSVTGAVIPLRLNPLPVMAV